ncbi:MAG: DUF3426 domain-containing protein [Desulfobacterales bacterium]|nr:DUF3426 domain-containing protein [Desulfobacterales bacterium]
MILTCQNCSTSFRLDESFLKPSGSKVRCSRCKHIWRARPPAVTMAAPEEPEDGDAPSALGAAAGLAAGAGMVAALAGGDPPAADEPEAPELKMGLEAPPAPESSEDDDLVTDEISLDELDLLLEDEPLPAGPEPEDDFKTEELNLADLEKMLDGDAGDAAAVEPLPGADDLNAFQEETEEGIIEDLDLDMDDLESLLEEDSDLEGGLEASTPAATVAEPPGDEIKLELDPGLEDLLENDVPEPDVEETEEIDLAEMEETPSDTAGGLTGAAGSADEEINLELAPGIDSLFDEVEDQDDVPLEETEELDFASLGDDFGPSAQDAGDGLDVASSLADEDIELGPAAGDDADDVATLDLGDLDSVLEDGDADSRQLSPGEEQPELVLELEGDTEDPGAGVDMDLALDDLDLGEPEALAHGPVEETRELELDELESLLDDADTPSAESPEEDVPEVEGLELDLDLDEDGVEAEEPDDATRELNLDDIEKILESQDDTPPAPPSMAEEEAPELDLDLDMGDTDAAAAPDGPDLLDMDETTQGSDSLDLSELEKMLDVEDTTDSPAPEADAAVEDLDLDFDLQPATDEGDDLELEFDMLEDEGEEPSALFDTSESEDLGLDLEMGDTPAPEKVEMQEDLEFEILDEDGKAELDLDIIEDDADHGEEIDLDLLEDDGEDFDLDIVADDASEEAAPVAAAAATAAGAVGSRDLTQELMDEMAAADTQTMDIPPAETKPIKPSPMPKKKKTSKSLVFLLLLILVGAAGYFGYTTTGFDVSKFKLSDLPEIPFVSKWLGVKQAPEAIVPVETALKGSWVDNQSDGRLYIIQGRVKNEYAEPRSFIRVTGQVFADGRNFKRSAQAYCGNMPSREDLENMPLADLQKLLSNRNGANNVNVKVAPGKEIPFTIIFAGLPEDVELQEYAVEISGSLPAVKP